MTKMMRPRYTLEFKQEAMRLVEGGQSIGAAARTLGVVAQTPFNWVKAQRQGKPTHKLRYGVRIPDGRSNLSEPATCDRTVGDNAR